MTMHVSVWLALLQAGALLVLMAYDKSMLARCSPGRAGSWRRTRLISTLIALAALITAYGLILSAGSYTILWYTLVVAIAALSVTGIASLALTSLLFLSRRRASRQTDV